VDVQPSFDVSEAFDDARLEAFTSTVFSQY
jgi:hypothetical protein